MPIEPRILSVEREHYEKIEGEPLFLEGKARKLCQMIRQNSSRS